MKPDIKILYAEDDATIAFLTQEELNQFYTIIHASDGEEALELFQKHDFQACVLDIMMPKKDGFEVAKTIRQQNSNIPILFLSAKTLKEDRIHGLRLGADDYLVKPFSIEELHLKIEVFLHRSIKKEASKTVYQIGKFIFDIANYNLECQEEKIQLTQREAQLLQLFLEHPNEVLKRETILIKLWGSDDYFLGRSLDVFISRLRKILQSETAISIDNIHGIGFRFTLKF